MIQNRIHKHIVLHENDEIKKFQDRIVNEINIKLASKFKKINKDVGLLLNKQIYYSTEINFLKIDKNILEVFKKINFDFNEKNLIENIEFGYLLYFMDYLRYHSTHFKISELSDEVIRYFTIESYTGFCECYGYYEYYNHVEIPKLFYENNNFIIFTELDGIEQFNLINEFKSSFENYYDEICNYFIYNYFLIEINSSESVPNLDIPNQKKEFDSKLKAHEWGVLGRLVIDQFYNKRKPTQWEMALAIHCITGYSKDKLKNTYITGQNKIDDLSDESKINLSTIIQSLIDELE